LAVAGDPPAPHRALAARREVRADGVVRVADLWLTPLGSVVGRRRMATTKAGTRHMSNRTRAARSALVGCLLMAAPVGVAATFVSGAAAAPPDSSVPAPPTEPT